MGAIGEEELMKWDKMQGAASAGKKLPKEASAGAVDNKKKRSKKSVETYKIYIFSPVQQFALLQTTIRTFNLKMISIAMSFEQALQKPLFTTHSVIVVKYWSSHSRIKTYFLQQLH